MKKHIKAFSSFLSKHDLRLTPARAAVATAVFSRHDHIDVETLVADLRPKRVSRATVYRTLDLMEQANLVRKVHTRSGGCLIEHLPGHPHHHHLVCTECGRIINFVSPEMEKIHNKIVRTHRFEEHSHAYEIFGLCKRCAKGSPDA